MDHGTRVGNEAQPGTIRENAASPSPRRSGAGNGGSNVVTETHGQLSRWVNLPICPPPQGWGEEVTKTVTRHAHFTSYFFLLFRQKL